MLSEAYRLLLRSYSLSVAITRDGLRNELQHEDVHDIMIDSSISQSHHVDLERELAPWVPNDDNLECPELDNTFDRHWNRFQGMNEISASGRAHIGIKRMGELDGQIGDLDLTVLWEMAEDSPRMGVLQQDGMNLSMNIANHEPKNSIQQIMHVK
ncbi:unnamed protein product [Lactuca saligna]|uniref:Uncharacterized protein n=1 Tax=Lactuca saligna TaxID=75948 RepID=A0AA36EF35_LACSI|nr:unnamed protein product [Lactuca saligna]